MLANIIIFWIIEYSRVKKSKKSGLCGIWTHDLMQTLLMQSMRANPCAKSPYGRCSLNMIYLCLCQSQIVSMPIFGDALFCAFSSLTTLIPKDLASPLWLQKLPRRPVPVWKSCRTPRVKSRLGQSSVRLHNTTSRVEKENGPGGKISISKMWRKYWRVWGRKKGSLGMWYFQRYSIFKNTDGRHRFWIKYDFK